jgi:hypothetical protein
MSEAPQPSIASATHARLRDKLAVLRALDPGREVFGAASHDHALSPPIPPEELVRFEATIGARLPEDYRAFLLHMGNGGAGPYYGIAPLALWEPDERPIAPGPMDDAAYDAWIERGDPTRAGDPRRDFVLDGLFHPLRIQDQRRLHHVPPGGAHPLDGCVLLAEMGCGESAFLVVRGARAGEVWIDQSQAAWPIRPVAPSFLAWYERRLDLGIGEALAAAVPRALVNGGIAPALVDAAAPIVEATWEALRGKVPAPESDEDLELDKAASAFAHLRLWQRRRDPVLADGVAPHLLALAFEGPERALEVIEGAPEPWAEILAVRARLLRRLGREDEALAAWDAVIRAAPHNPDWPRHKAWLQIARGDLAGAEATILAMAEARRDPEEAAELVLEFAEALEGEAAARFRALTLVVANAVGRAAR